MSRTRLPRRTGVLADDGVPSIAQIRPPRQPSCTGARSSRRPRRHDAAIRRSLARIGYPAAACCAPLLIGHSCLALELGTVAVDSVNSPRSVVLGDDHVLADAGHALGDWTADTAGLRLRRVAWRFSPCCSRMVAVATDGRSFRDTALFWAAFVLTRPLGAVVGDFLDKPLNAGGLDLSRFGASADTAGVHQSRAWSFVPQRPRNGSTLR